MLTLSIDQDSFEEIRSGRKKEEYREIKPYYTSKLVKEFPFTMMLRIPKHEEIRPVQFKVGVSPKAPKLLANCSLTMDGGQEEWGAVPGEWYYVLKIYSLVDEGQTKVSKTED